MGVFVISRLCYFSPSAGVLITYWVGIEKLGFTPDDTAAKSMFAVIGYFVFSLIYTGLLAASTRIYEIQKSKKEAKLLIENKQNKYAAELAQQKKDNEALVNGFKKIYGHMTDKEKLYLAGICYEPKRIDVTKERLNQIWTKNSYIVTVAIPSPSEEVITVNSLLKEFIRSEAKKAIQSWWEGILNLPENDRKLVEDFLRGKNDVIGVFKKEKLHFLYSAVTWNKWSNAYFYKFHCFHDIVKEVIGFEPADNLKYK